MLKYIGNGNWLPGVPARDLTDAEAEVYGGVGTLLATGLYAETPAAKPAKIRHAAEPAIADEPGTPEETGQEVETWQE